MQTKTLQKNHDDTNQPKCLKSPTYFIFLNHTTFSQTHTHNSENPAQLPCNFFDSLAALNFPCSRKFKKRRKTVSRKAKWVKTIKLTKLNTENTATTRKQDNARFIFRRTSLPHFLKNCKNLSYYRMRLKNVKK